MDKPVTRLAASERKSEEAADKAEDDSPSDVLQAPPESLGEQAEAPTAGQKRMGRPKKDPAAEAGLAARLAR